jgi:hypothetical protein
MVSNRRQTVTTTWLEIELHFLEDMWSSYCLAFARYTSKALTIGVLEVEQEILKQLDRFRVNGDVFVVKTRPVWWKG